MRFLIKTVKKIKHLANNLDYHCNQAVKFCFVRNTFFGNKVDSLNASVAFNRKTVLKYEDFILDKKANDILQEAQIIKYLNEKNCISCPQFIKQGRSLAGKNYIVMEKIIQKGTSSFGDILFALIEQKNLGVWHGDIRPENIIFDGEKAVLIDYDQAKILPEIIEMDNIEFLHHIANEINDKWDNYFEKHYGANSVEDFVNQLLPYFKNGAFNLGETTLFKTQVTTISDTGFYHTLNTKDVFIEGMRDFDSRIPILDEVPFQKDEKILDFGCNAGLLSFYLEGRGAKVSGCDMDKSIITAATALSHILNKKVNFFKCDIDYERFQKNFDTICLFSVIHHTKFMERNAKFLAGKCSRILIECRLEEIGQKPTPDGWIYTSKWKFNTESELCNYLEKLFPKFKFEKIWGKGDRDRFIITLKKEKK